MTLDLVAYLVLFLLLEIQMSPEIQNMCVLSNTQSARLNGLSLKLKCLQNQIAMI